MKVIVHPETGTVIPAKECYVVDDDVTSETSTILWFGTDAEKTELAHIFGTPLQEIGINTGWGDNKYRWSVSYSPNSLIDEAESLIEAELVIDGTPEYDALQWLISKSSQETRESISDYIMSDDELWIGFRYNFMEGVMWAYNANNQPITETEEV